MGEERKRALRLRTAWPRPALSAGKATKSGAQDGSDQVHRLATVMTDKDRADKARRVARLAWASPGSVVGLLLAPFFDRRFVVRGVLVCEGASWPRKLGFRHRAITFGHVVLSVDELDWPTLEHELVHVAQYERWGPLFMPAYVLASAVARLRGGHSYLDNAFEREAQRRLRH